METVIRETVIREIVVRNAGVKETGVRVADFRNTCVRDTGVRNISENYFFSGIEKKYRLDFFQSSLGGASRHLARIKQHIAVINAIRLYPSTSHLNVILFFHGGPSNKGEENGH